VQLLETSRPLPIVRGQIRIKKPEADRLVAAMRDAIAAHPRQGSSLGAVLEAAEAVEDALYRAMPVPMTDDVRLPRTRLEELIATLRTAGA
jgi:hypothetical protein